MERCTLCGGKLVNGRCTECGLDNTKNDKKYHLNIHNEKGALLHQGDCEDHLNRGSDWLERLHERRKRLSGAATGNRQADVENRQGSVGSHQGSLGNRQDSMGPSQRKPASQAVHKPRQERMKELKKRRETGTVKGKQPLATFLLLMFVILIIAGVFVRVTGSLTDSGGNLFGDLFGTMRSELSGEEQAVPVPPEPADWDTDSEKYFELEMKPGFYTVGYEIPAGRYQFVCGEDTADIHWIDPGQEYDSYIYLYSESRRESYQEAFQEECPFFPRSEVVNLEDGAVIQAGNDEPGTMLKGMAEEAGSLPAHAPQDITAEVMLEDGMIVGEDFEEGVYDLVMEMPEDPDDYMGAYLNVSGAEGEESLYNMIVDSTNPCYLRIPFRTGSTVTVEKYTGKEEDCIVRLIPSY